jgi:murein DD-endopeptidase MepM/ murein hydrolase activator NlpD
VTSIRRRAFWLTLVVVLGLAAPPLAADESSDRLDDIRRQLAEVDSQIRASRSEASEVGRQVAAAQEVLDQAVANYRAATHRVDETVAEVNQTETRVAVLEGDLELLEEALARTELELAATEDRMEEQAVLLYMQASAVPSLDFFIQSSLADAAAAFAYAGDVFNRDDSVFASYQILEREETRQREALVARKAEAEAELARLEELQDRLETEQEEADRVRAEAEEQAAAAAALLSNIHAAIAAAEEHKDGLEADARALEEEIARRQDPGGERPGLLAWPINGRVVSPFGYRVHPILGIRRLHTGIDIDASTGDPIRAAEAGRVILAQTYGGYGRAVVIDHGGGMATLYAHQSSLAVSQGDQVERGEVIGYVGCTGLCTGPHLHFEVRINGGFVDPMDYLP